MVLKSRSSQGCSCPTRRLSHRFQKFAKTSKETYNFEQIPEPPKANCFKRSSRDNASKRCDNPCKKSFYSGILQQTISCPQTQPKMETGYRSELSEHPSQHTHLQDGNSRNNPEVDPARGVGGICRLNRCLFSHPNSSSITKISKISDRSRYFSISSPTLRPGHCTSRIHSGSEGGKTDCSISKPKIASVSRRLAASFILKRAISRRFTKTSTFNPGNGLDYQFWQVRTRAHSRARFSRLPFRFKQRPGLSYSKETESPEITDCFHQEGSLHNPKEANVPDRAHGLPRKDHTIGKAAYEAFPVVSKNSLEVPSVSGFQHSSYRGTSKTFGLVGEHTQSYVGFPSSAKCSQHPFVHRRFTKRLGSSLRKTSAKWPLVKQRSTASYQYSRNEGCSSEFKRFQGQNSRSISPDLFRQQFCGSVPQQSRGYSLHRNVCPDLENSGVHSLQKNSDQSQARTRVSECDSRLSITEEPGVTDRMVSPSRDIQSDLQSMAQTHDRPICNPSEHKTTHLCFTCPRQKGMENRCIEYLLGGTGRLCLQSSRHIVASHSKDSDLPMQSDCDSSRLARDALVLGPSGSFSQDSTESPSLENSPETTPLTPVSRSLSIPESPCLASGLQETNSRGFSKEVAERIKAPQRESSRKVYQSRWSIYEKWCQEHKMDITLSTVQQVAEFLNYLFTVKNLKPATISGYRTAIADSLGSEGESISKSSELNRLIASFARDRPKPNSSIPTWDLSLVLLALTKGPFEPLQDAPIKWLTYKTVFLLALASGKRRGEIHAWTHSSVSSRSNWSQVTVAPSPAFLAKNQLATTGPESIKPVVIPALSNLVDDSMPEDLSLCPVRALRIYLDRTKTLRKGKNLLFISLREGYSRDISRITISQWIKQTVQTCYQLADDTDQQVAQIRAHDVRAMAASLAFKGGVSLEQILGSCYWRSHNTFTSFYLKDLCWENENLLKLGPIVAAQHIIDC